MGLDSAELLFSASFSETFSFLDVRVHTVKFESKFFTVHQLRDTNRRTMRSLLRKPHIWLVTSYTVHKKIIHYYINKLFTANFAYFYVFLAHFNSVLHLGAVFH